ncbi:MAG: preprotein translocase subunit SecG [Thermoguttaceae bacterium]
MVQALLILLLIFISVFLILLIMIQRGKGGGLAGAFGGMGGQSAFGTKAGDTFTKITVVTAVIWFMICIVSIWVLNHNPGGGLNFDGSGSANQTAPAEGSSQPDAATPAPASASDADSEK